MKIITYTRPFTVELAGRSFVDQPLIASPAGRPGLRFYHSGLYSGVDENHRQKQDHA